MPRCPLLPSGNFLFLAAPLCLAVMIGRIASSHLISGGGMGSVMLDDGCFLETSVIYVCENNSELVVNQEEKRELPDSSLV